MPNISLFYCFFYHRHLATTVLNRQLLINGCKLPELRLSQERLCREMVRPAVSLRVNCYLLLPKLTVSCFVDV